MSVDFKFCRLVLKNWKNFAYADVAIQDRIFLVGPNISNGFNLANFGNFFGMPDFNMANPFNGLPNPAEIFKLPQNPFSYGNPFEA